MWREPQLTPVPHKTNRQTSKLAGSFQNDAHQGYAAFAKHGMPHIRTCNIGLQSLKFEDADLAWATFPGDVIQFLFSS